jgi:hypothetical protein
MIMPGKLYSISRIAKLRQKFVQYLLMKYTQQANTNSYLYKATLRLPLQVPGYYQAYCPNILSS